MIDASPLLSALIDHLQSGGSGRTNSEGFGIGQSLQTRIVVAELIGAFHPLCCTAEVYDYEKQLRYRVFGPSGNAAISISGIPLSRLFAHEALRAEIDKTRAQLEYEGFALSSREHPGRS